MRGIDAVVNAPPGGQRHPHQHRPAEQQHRDRRRQKEIVLKGEAALVQRGPRPISDSKRQRGQKNIGESKKNPNLTMVSSEHADVRIALVSVWGREWRGISCRVRPTLPAVPGSLSDRSYARHALLVVI